MEQTGIEKFFFASISFFQNLDYPVFLSYLKDVLILVSLLFAGLLIMIIFKMRNMFKQHFGELKKEVLPPTEAVSVYDNRWEEIKNHVRSFNEAEWKMAVIEGDKFVDDALKVANYPGESMGERLMLIQPGQLLSLQELWDAHKLRNLLVHDVSYQLTHRQAVMAVEIFEKVLRELGALT
jgi:hypothetical protein